MKKTNIAFISAGALVLLAFGSWTLMQRSDDSAANAPTSASADTPTAKLPEGEVVAEVIMNKDGYEPSTIALKAGQAIRFVNSSDGKRWPASNIHPTHDIYPEFDPRKELQPGENWSFTFRQKGSWRMHDHLFPYMKGVVTVN